jgi:hypothetical protein
VGEDLADASVAADDGVFGDFIHLLAFFEFSNGFHNFSFGDESDDFADDKDDGTRAGDDDEHGENFSGIVEGMHLAVAHAEHGDDDHVDRVHEVPAVEAVTATQTVKTTAKYNRLVRNFRKMLFAGAAMSLNIEYPPANRRRNDFDHG